MTKTRILASIVALATVALLATPARAATVTVYFGVAAVTHASTEGLCPVSIQTSGIPGHDGEAVLSAAVARGCIRSYELGDPDPQFGRPLACVDGVCGWPREPYGTAGTYWALWLNGASASTGIDGYVAADLDRIEASYTHWLSCEALEC